MNRFIAILLLSLSVLVVGCVKPDVKYSELIPATTATISDNSLTIHLGASITDSACWVRTKVRVEGQTVYIVGYRTFQERSSEFVVQLPASSKPQLLSVVWINPDGSHVNVPITKLELKSR